MTRTRKNFIKIEDNPSRQEKDNKVKEISFFNHNGDYYGLLMGLRFNNSGDPVINLYCIDEGIIVNVSSEREKRNNY